MNPRSPYDDKIVTLGFVCEYHMTPEEARENNPYKKQK